MELLTTQMQAVSKEKKKEKQISLEEKKNTSSSEPQGPHRNNQIIEGIRATPPGHHFQA